MRVCRVRIVRILRGRTLGQRQVSAIHVMNTAKEDAL